ncbi:MAG: hypothetical protein HYX94_03030 [Chloroflexi bacterium]|nr:hypothetical protein [Chloroflexota bacterium]
MANEVLQAAALAFTTVLRFLWQDFSLLAATLLQMLFPMVVCCLLIHNLRRLLMRRIGAAFGWPGVLAVSWLGTPIHELSHAACIVLTGMKLMKLALFEPNRETGGLGYVKFSYLPRNPLHQLGCFLSAMAPLVGGSLAIYGATRLLLPDFALYDSSTGVPFFQPSDVLDGQKAGWVVAQVYGFELAILRQMVGGFSLSDWRTYLYIYFVFSVAHNMSPSALDLIGFPRRLAYLLLVLLVVNAPLLFFGSAGSAFYRETLLPPVLTVAAGLTAILYLGAIVCLVAAVVSLPITGLVHSLRR